MNLYGTQCEHDARLPTDLRCDGNDMNLASELPSTWQTPLIAGLSARIEPDARHRFVSVNGAPSSKLNAQVIREIVEHSHRTGLFMVDFAKVALDQLGAHHDQQSIAFQAQMLGAAALFHDVGKFAVPSCILGKPGKLRREEFDVVKRHPYIGAHMIGNAGARMPADFVRTARSMASLHHEHWDGSGYPFGLSGLQIPFAARLLAIVDVYDALAHARAYKSAQSHDEAIRVILDARGSLFDPALVDIFVEYSCDFSSQRATHGKGS
jgi:HD-GYP domain-containing protein (c-di-GMP phosphodiesterase class II)